MKKIPFYNCIGLVAALLYAGHPEAHPLVPGIVASIDSVGVEKKDGKRFILHRVDEGQTLFAIARRYHRTVADIRAANPDLKDGVRYGQLVRIQIPEGTLTRKEARTIDKAIKKQDKAAKSEAVADTPKPSAAKPPKATPKTIIRSDDPAKAGIHVVETGQTLYSLASRYGVSQEDLRKWNSLSGNNVLIGQALIVSEKAYLSRLPSTPTTPRPADTPVRRTGTETVAHGTPRAAEPHKAEPRPVSPPAESRTDHRPESSTPPPSAKTTDPKAAETDTKTAAKAPDKPAEEIEPPRPGNDAPMPTVGRRISSSGVAEMIEGNDGSGKYLALHRTAPIGTLVQVRNEFNNQSIWVKVIGRLPNTGVNDKILIKLSRQAFAKLSPVDRRFRAEVSYIVR